MGATAGSVRRRAEFQVDDRRLTSGSEFLRRLMLFLGVMSTAAVGLVSACFYTLMRLSALEWHGFLQILAGVGPAMFIGTSLLNR